MHAEVRVRAKSEERQAGKDRCIMPTKRHGLECTNIYSFSLKQQQLTRVKVTALK